MSAESAIKARLSEVCDPLEVPGVVAVANAEGSVVQILQYSPFLLKFQPESFEFAEAFGVNSLKQGEAHNALKLDSTFFLASATKLLTAVSVLQCVEQGQLNLYEDVTHWLPELKDPVILTGFDDEGKPILVKAVEKITLRYVIVSYVETELLFHLFLKLPFKQRIRELDFRRTGLI
jgi:D-alanyl-D-alanine carboxypeptidase